MAQSSGRLSSTAVALTTDGTVTRPRRPVHRPPPLGAESAARRRRRFATTESEDGREGGLRRTRTARARPRRLFRRRGHGRSIRLAPPETRRRGILPGCPQTSRDLDLVRSREFLQLSLFVPSKVRRSTPDGGDSRPGGGGAVTRRTHPPLHRGSEGRVLSGEGLEGGGGVWAGRPCHPPPPATDPPRATSHPSERGSIHERGSPEDGSPLPVPTS